MATTKKRLTTLSTTNDPINCGSCFHFMWPQDPDAVDKRGECRRYPPRPVVFTEPTHRNGQPSIQRGTQSVWLCLSGARTRA